MPPIPIPVHITTFTRHSSQDRFHFLHPRTVHCTTYKRPVALPSSLPDSSCPTFSPFRRLTVILQDRSSCKPKKRQDRAPSSIRCRAR